MSNNKRYPGMYSFYKHEIGQAKEKLIHLLHDVPQDVLDGLYEDGTITMLDLQGCGRDSMPEDDESVESSRKRTFEVIEYMAIYCQRINTVTIDSVGDDEADKLEAETRITDENNYPTIDEYKRLYGFDPTDIDVRDVDVVEVKND